MKETIKVKIIEAGKAIEVSGMLSISEYQEAFNCGMEGLLSYEEAFIEAESNLRTFEIYEFEAGDWDLNSIHQAKLLENGKIEII